MNLAKHVPDWIDDKLPDDGAMGALKRKRPSLYALAIATGGAAFAGVLLALFYTLALLPLVGGRAIVAVASGEPVLAWAWTLLLAAVGVLLVGVVVVVGRWVGEFTTSDKE